MFIDLLREELGEDKGAGNETRFNCPFCENHNNKFKFYVENADLGRWICQRCGEKGNPAAFVMKWFEVDYAEAKEILLTYDYDVDEFRKQRTSFSNYGAGGLTEEERLLLYITREGEPLEDEIKKITYTCPRPPTNCKSLMENFNNPEAFIFFQYLQGRGVTLENIRDHNISYVTYGEVELVDGRKMNLINHLIFFTFNDLGVPIYWNTRSIDPNPFIKSFNAPAKTTEYSKNNSVFNLNRARFYDKIVVTEGVFNALTVGYHGVATFGKKVTEEQVRIMLNATEQFKTPIYLFLDKDAWKEMIQSAHTIHRIDPTRPVYYVNSPTNEDANDIGTDRCYEWISNAFLADAQGDLQLQLLNM